MALRRRRLIPGGVFVVEVSTWEPDDLSDGRSVKPLLELLRTCHWPPVESIWRSAATIAEFQHYLDAWTSTVNRDFGLLWIVAHGRRGEIVLDSDQDSDRAISLDWLEARLAGRANGRMIHLSTCGTLDLPHSRLVRFLKATGARMLSGYASEEVCWLRSAAFELHAISLLQDLGSNPRGLHAFPLRIRAELGPMARRFGFRVAINASHRSKSL